METDKRETDKRDTDKRDTDKREKYENGLFIFRRDLRIVDNKGLEMLQKTCKNIFPIFIFTPEQVGSGNSYRSKNAVQFMIETLQDLEGQIAHSGGKLYTFYGTNEKIVKECIKAFDVDVVCFNLDVSPYAIERDAKIEEVCNQMDVQLIYGHDYYLHHPGSVMNGSGHAYQKFTPYYESCLKKKVEEPKRATRVPFIKGYKGTLVGRITLSQALTKFVGKSVNQDILVRGGREKAIAVLKTAHREQSQGRYQKIHNDLDKRTTQLSAYIKFGCVSIREVYHVFKKNAPILRQLIWRDFYATVLFFYPYVLGHSMKKNYRRIKWSHNERWFNSWTNGTTGFPIVDAGMRQMNETGYMHNRARLIVASFLVKILLIDWRKGEKYFATKLTDYDVASNNGNWQWVAGTGADSQPYFRIFNPWRQTEEYDPECIYIKEWVPELENVLAKDIFNWEKEWSNHKDTGYCKPICSYEIQKEKALQMYKGAFN
jgi:deoxyribodipyrimidine photo-lyase